MALEEVREGLKRDPDCIELLNTFASIQIFLKNYDGAQTTLEYVLKKDGDDQTAQRNLKTLQGLMLQNSGKERGRDK